MATLARDARADSHPERAGAPVTRSVRPPEDRVKRRGIRAWALAAAVAACAAAAVPAGAATVDYPPGPDAPAPTVPDDPAPHPDAPPLTTVPAAGAPLPAPAAAETADAPRPVAERPTAGGGGAANDASLAIRRLTVTASVELTEERPARLTVMFVPRPGSLVAQVRVSARHSVARRLVISRLVRVRSGHRATVRLRVMGMEPRTYEVSVRAGATRATLGPAVVARLRID
jgi:hypothetical protein